MNEIQPSNIQYILWSDDDSYSDKSIFTRDEFARLLESITLDNELLAYGNVAYDDGRHNTLMESLPNTLLGHASSNKWQTTWFIDDNNDLWCRDEAWADGVNYYLYREFNTKDQSVILPIKISLVKDLPSFDSDLVLDNTVEIGTRIIEKADLNRTINHTPATMQYVNAEDLTYMTMIINQQLDNVLSNNSYELDTLSETLVDCLNAWYQWDKNKGNSNVTTIDSMIDFVDTFDKMILSYLNQASYDDLNININKGKEL